MQRRIRRDLVDGPRPGAELPLPDERVHHVPAQAVVKCEFGREMPFVLYVDPKEDRLRIIIVHDTDWRRRLLTAVRVRRKNLRMVVEFDRLAAQIDAGAYRVLGVPSIGGVGLDSVDQARMHQPGRDTIEDEIADGIGIEVQAIVAAEVGGLVIKLGADGSIQRQYSEIVLLEFALGHAICRVARDSGKLESGRRIRVRRNLKKIYRCAGDQAHARVGPKRIREIAEHLPLIGVVV